jgi:hypothetical protein
MPLDRARLSLACRAEGYQLRRKRLVASTDCLWLGCSGGSPKATGGFSPDCVGLRHIIRS